MSQRGRHLMDLRIRGGRRIGLCKNCNFMIFIFNNCNFFILLIFNGLRITSFTIFNQISVV
jgi:hypothetical protein